MVFAPSARTHPSIFSLLAAVGTYVIVISVVLLIVNGPGTQDYGDQHFEGFVLRVYAIIWGCVLMGGMLLTGIWLLVFDLHKQPQTWIRFAVLLVARSSAFALNLTTGKAVVLPQSRAWLIGNIVIKILSGGIYTRAIMVQSTAVRQKTFVPINAVTIVFVNALTGIIIWEDWRVVSSWLAYVSVFLLMALGCCLLLGDLGLLQESSPETFRGARPTMIKKSERDRLIRNIRNVPCLAEMDYDKSQSCREISFGFDDDVRIHHYTTGLHSFPQNRRVGEESIHAYPKTYATLESSEDASVPTTIEPNASDDEVPTQPSSPPADRLDRPYHSHRHGSSGRSLVQRNTKSQAAWAAIYEFGNAVHQGDIHHHSFRYCSDPRRPNTTMALGESHEEMVDGSAVHRGTRHSHSMLGWDSFQRRLRESKEDGSNSLKNQSCEGTVREANGNAPSQT